MPNKPEKSETFSCCSDFISREKKKKKKTQMESFSFRPAALGQSGTAENVNFPPVNRTKLAAVA